MVQGHSDKTEQNDEGPGYQMSFHDTNFTWMAHQEDCRHGGVVKSARYESQPYIAVSETIPFLCGLQICQLLPCAAR